MEEMRSAKTEERIKLHARKHTHTHTRRERQREIIATELIKSEEWKRHKLDDASAKHKVKRNIVFLEHQNVSPRGNNRNHRRDGKHNVQTNERGSK